MPVINQVSSDYQCKNLTFIQYFTVVSGTSESFEKEEGRFDQLEVQIAEVLNTRNQGEQPSKTKIDPNEHTKAITLQSSKKLSDSKVVEQVSMEKEKESKKGVESEREKSREPIEIEKVSHSNTAPIPLVPFP